MDRRYPTTQTEAGLFLLRIKTRLKQELYPTYNDQKAAQLLDALSEQLFAEARVKAWFVDLGFDGQCQEDSSIGGVSCIQGLTD